MSGKTPSSLNWLIRKQTRLAGQMLRKRDHLDRLRQQVSQCKSEIAVLQKTRSQVEAVMRLHEVQVDPNDLRPIRPHYHFAVLGHGGMTRIVFATLRNAVNSTATTREIAAAVLDALPQQSDVAEISRIKHRIRVRLCIMALKGALVKLPQPSPHEPCSWRPATAPSPSP